MIAHLKAQKQLKEVDADVLLDIYVSNVSQVVVLHTYNPSTLGGRSRWTSKFEASLIYRVSSRTAMAI